MSDQQNISSFIWNVADDVLRGLFKPHEYGQIILPFTVLKRMDLIIEPHKEKILKLHKEWKSKSKNPEPIILSKIKLNFFNYSNYDFKKLSQDHQNIKKNFENYLSRFSENIYDVIENFEIKDHIKKLDKNDRLFILIEKFNSIDLSPEKVSNFEMGQIFEELLRRFSEMANETSGEHYTPRDVINLLVELIFNPDKKKLQNTPVVSLFDSCCGTGGMLTVGKEWFKRNFKDKIDPILFGQELNPETFAVCKGEMLITGEDPENIRYGNSLCNDRFQNQKFQYMIINPPYGQSWKADLNFIKKESQKIEGRFNAGLPRTSDGQLLFIQHLISKMDEEGSRIGIVTNASPLSVGEAESGESEIRKWIIENDMLEVVVGLPDEMFFNTGLQTFLWIITNKKTKERKGKIQLLDGTSFYENLKRNLGNKRKVIIQKNIDDIIKLYSDFKENKKVRILPNNFFEYKKVVSKIPLKENGEVVKDKKGKIKFDKNKKDFEKIPFLVNIKEYFNKEVLPYAPETIFDEKKYKIGYEINFNQFFYEFENLRSVDEIQKDLDEINNKLKQSLNDVFK